MKHLLYTFFFFFLIINKEVLAFADTTQNKLFLTNDSGFVTKKEGLEFLLANSLTDTMPWSDTIYHNSPITLFDGTISTYWIDSGSDSWYLIKQNDTIGKYYRIENSNNFMMCLIDHGSKYDFETHLVIEVTSNGELIKSERFFHGNHPCCWNNYYDGFSKYGDFFGIKICGTGSGHCSSRLYLFKKVTPQDSINFILLNCWSVGDFVDSGESSLYDSYTSSIDIKKDKLVIHYVSESGTHKYNEKTKDLDFKVNRTEKISIEYFYENEKWETKDRENLEKLEEWCYF
jgi:hypothetical protein